MALRFLTKDLGNVRLFCVDHDDIFVYSSIVVGNEGKSSTKNYLTERTKAYLDGKYGWTDLVAFWGFDPDKLSEQSDSAPVTTYHDLIIESKSSNDYKKLLGDLKAALGVTNYIVYLQYSFKALDNINETVKTALKYLSEAFCSGVYYQRDAYLNRAEEAVLAYLG